MTAESYTLGADPRLDRGNTAINRPQIFVANAVYYLPDLKGSNGFVQAVLGGWELAGITQYASGVSLSLYQAGVSEATGLVPGDGYASSAAPGALVDRQRLHRQPASADLRARLQPGIQRCAGAQSAGGHT